MILTKLNAYIKLSNKLKGKLMVCGSTALQFHGLIENSDSADLDLVLIHDSTITDEDKKEDKKILGLWSMINSFDPYEGADQTVVGSRYFIVFNDGPKVLNTHVFLAEKLLHPNYTKADFGDVNNVMFVSPKNVIEAKKLFNRPKDIKSLTEIAKSLL